MHTHVSNINEHRERERGRKRERQKHTDAPVIIDTCASIHMAPSLKPYASNLQPRRSASQIRRFASLTDSQIAVIRKPTNLRICANL